MDGESKKSPRWDNRNLNKSQTVISIELSRLVGEIIENENVDYLRFTLFHLFQRSTNHFSLFGKENTKREFLSK